MEEKQLWGVTKVMKYSIIYYSHKNWLSKSYGMWVPDEKFATSFTDKGEARKALNKKLSHEIANWGLNHVSRWVYKVEKLK